MSMWSSAMSGYRWITLSRQGTKSSIGQSMCWYRHGKKLKESEKVSWVVIYTELWKYSLMGTGKRRYPLLISVPGTMICFPCFSVCVGNLLTITNIVAFLKIWLGILAMSFARSVRGMDTMKLLLRGKSNSVSIIPMRKSVSTVLIGIVCPGLLGKRFNLVGMRLLSLPQLSQPEKRI